MLARRPLHLAKCPNHMQVSTQHHTTVRSMLCHIYSTARLLQSPWRIPTPKPSHVPPSTHAATPHHIMVSRVSRKVHRELYSSSAVICDSKAISRLQTSQAAAHKPGHARSQPW